MSTIYGTPKYVVESDQTDRYAVRRTRFSIAWGTDENEATAVVAKRPEMPTFKDAKLVMIGTLPKDGGYITWWDFESIDEEVLPLKNRDTSPEFRFEGDLAEVDIKLYPEFTALLELYGGTILSDGTIDWPATIQSSNSGVGIGGSAGTSTTNPMYGIESWYRQTGLYIFRYAEKELPADLFSRVGKTLETAELPGKPPKTLNAGDDTSQKRNWLGRTPQYENLANGFAITETYWLSGPGGWPLPVYPKA